MCPLSLSLSGEQRPRSGCYRAGRFLLLSLPLHGALGEYGFDGLRFGLLFERLHASAHDLEERPAQRLGQGLKFMLMYQP